MKLSVIIPTRNRQNTLIDCLKSIAAQTVKPHEIIVVDSSDCAFSSTSDFEKVNNILSHAGIVLIYQHTTHAGASYQRNRAMTLAQGDIFYFFDDDVILDKNYIKHMQEIIEQHKEYAGGMGTVQNINTTYSINRVLRTVFLMQRNNTSGRFTFSGMPTHAYGKKTFCDIAVLGGCGMCYRAPIVKHYQFDEKLGKYSYMEDCDLSKRISRQYKLFYNPDATLEHFHSPLNRDTIVNNRAIFIRNYSYLFFKNFYPENKIRIIGYVWTILGLFIEALILIRNFNYIRGYARGLRDYYWSTGFARNHARHN